MTLLLIALVLATGSSFLLYRRGPWYLLMIRALALAALVALLVNPRIKGGVPLEPKVLVILDLSPSMGEVVAWEDSTLGKIRSLPGKKDIVGVSDRLINDPALPLSVDSSDCTDLSLALSRGADAFILLSDGLHNAPSEVYPLAPVLTIIPPKSRRFNISLLDLELPRTISVGQEFPLTASYALRGGDWRGRCLISLAGETVKDTSLLLREGQGFLRFNLVAKNPGQTRLVMRLIPDMSEDATEDNSRSRTINIEEGGFGLAIIAEGPWPDVGAVRRAAEGVPGIVVRTFARLASGRWTEMKGDSVVDCPGPQRNADAFVLIGSRKELGNYRAGKPCLIFMVGDNWGIPGASEYRGGGVYLGSAAGSPVPDSILKPLPPITRFWKIPASQAQEILLLAGSWPVVFRREGDVYVACPELWAQNTASGGELYRIIVSDFISRALSGKMSLFAWAKDAFSGQPVFINAEARLADGSPAGDVWPRVAGQPMRQIGPGVFQAGPLELEPGDHSFRVDFYRGNDLAGTKTVSVSVAPWPAEAYDWGVDTGFLRGLAEGSGGFLARSPEELRGFLEGLRSPSPPLKLLDIPWLILLPVLLLVAEWGLRRWLGKV
ncbi:MAG: hypothetical protein ACP5QG_06610 [candidate division WOR-3 bacterium]